MSVARAQGLVGSKREVAKSSLRLWEALPVSWTWRAGHFRRRDIMKIGNDEYLRKSLDVFRIVARHNCDDPITGAKIEELTSVDTRTVADMLREFEQAGFMVISTGRGYGIARNVEEWNNHLNKEYDRGLSILRKVSQSKKRRENAPSLFDKPHKMLQQSQSTPIGSA